MRNVSDKHMRKSVDFLKEYSMDFLDYREKLGIGCYDGEKFTFFLTKIFNCLNGISEETHSGCVTSSEYFSFCNLTGSRYNQQLFAGCHNRERFNECLTILDRHRNSLEEFLAYYIAFTNSITPQKSLPQNWTREHFANLLLQMSAESHIPVELIKNDDEYFAFPKGAKELDDALVSQPLEWLSAYPMAQKTFIIALKQYSEGIYIRDVADNLRKALEAFLQEFLGNEKNLETNKNEICKYLGSQGVDAGISGLFQPLLNAYKNINDRIAKHNDAVDKKLLEFLLYQTGVLIRMVVVIKMGETSHEV